MKLVRRRELPGDDLSAQIRRRLRDIHLEIDRLTRERTTLEGRLGEIERITTARRTRVGKATASGVACPRCGRDRDFLTDADGYLAHVLEEAGDTDLLSDGKPLYCPACGEVFLYRGQGDE